MPPQDDFAEKVIQSLKKNQRAVDLTEPKVEDEVVVQSDFEAKGSQDAGGDGPLTGGNKDINIVPGYGGVAATSVSQINFYWNSPATPDISGFGQSVRTTIFNYASSATNPLLVIGGWNGSTNYVPSQAWGGAGAGTTAKIFIDPFRGHITLDYVDLNTSGIASTTRAGSIWYDTTGTRVRVGTGAATAKTFAYTDDLISATSVSIGAATGFTVLYPTFSNVSASAAGVALSVDVDVNYNPLLNLFTVPVITGTAATFTNFTGSLIGTATTAQNVNVATSGAVTGPFYFAMVNTGTGSGLALSTDTNLSYNAAVDVLTVANISGTAITGTSLSGKHFGDAAGTAATYTTVFASLVGTATTAQNVNVATTNNVAGVFYLPLLNSATGSGLALSSDTALSYNSAVDVLTVTNISGTAITGTSLSGKHFGDAAGTAATYTTVFASLVGTATTAQNVNVATTNNAVGTFYIPLINTATGSGVAVSSDTALSYNSAVDVLTVTNISGTAITAVTFSGAFSGSATTAQNINVNTASAAGAHYLLMSPSASGSGVAVSTDASLSYVPSTDTLTMANISGLGVTLSASSALAQGTYFTIKTTGSDDNSTDDFFIRGLNSSNQSKFSVDANGNLRATTKSFDIPHPTKDGLRLVYGVLEGPEHGVYHRGTVEGKGNVKVQLPEYWSKLVSPDYTVHLTTWGNYSAHIIEKAEDYFTISISSNVLVKALKNIKVDYIVHGSRLDAVLVIEQDA